MKTKTNEELAQLYQESENAEEAFAQLLDNLTPMIVKIGKYHLSSCGIYDTDDYIQEGSIVLWNLLEKGTFENKAGKLSSLFYTAFRNRCIRMYWSYVGKNLVPVNDSEDYYHYGYQITTLVEDSHLEEHRKRTREQNERWYEKKYGKKLGKRVPLSEEERQKRDETRKQRQRAYVAEHRGELRSKRKAWYQENRDYALFYQKAYSQGVRIGKKGPPKKTK